MDYTTIIEWLYRNYQPTSDYYDETLGGADLQVGDDIAIARKKLSDHLMEEPCGFLLTERLEEAENGDEDDPDTDAVRLEVAGLADDDLDLIMYRFELKRIQRGHWDTYLVEYLECLAGTDTVMDDDESDSSE